MAGMICVKTAIAPATIPTAIIRFITLTPESSLMEFSLHGSLLKYTYLLSNLVVLQYAKFVYFHVYPKDLTPRN